MGKLKKIAEKVFMGTVLTETYIDEDTGEKVVIVPSKAAEQEEDNDT